MSSKFLQLVKIQTNQNGADMMTKVLPKEKLQVYNEVAGMMVPPHELEGEICWEILLMSGC